MLIEDRKAILNFVIRTGMYISQQDRHNIISFIHGFETGSEKKDFTEKIKKYIAKQFKLEADGRGWNGQIERLSEKLNYDWETTFKKVSLEILMVNELGSIDRELSDILKVKINISIKRIDKDGKYWNFIFMKDWLTDCHLKSNWFAQMWTVNELEIIKAIDDEVQADNIFIDKGKHIPTKKFLSLQRKWQALTKKQRQTTE